MMRWLVTEHWRIGASLMRVSLGSWAVYFFLLHWPYRRFLWGPNGVLPYKSYVETRSSFSLFQLNDGLLYLEALYTLAILLGILLVIGWRTRLIVPLHWLIIWSFQERNPLLPDGGDNIMRIVLLFLAFTNCGASFSVDSLRKGRSHPAVAVLHNIGVLLVIGQLCFVYMSTGLYKAMGEVWQNGTALYYILRVDEFSWPGMAERIYTHPALVVLGTYGTVLFEVLFSPALLNRWTRYAMIAAGFAFHLGITLFMGLVTFGWSMLSIYPLLLLDEEYASLSAWARRLGERFRLTVFYDGWCPMCRRTVCWLNAGNLLGLVRYVSFRETKAPAGAENRLLAVRGAIVREGIDAYIEIALRSPLLWPLVPILFIAKATAGQRLYDAIAQRRFILAGCEQHCERGNPLEM